MTIIRMFSEHPRIKDSNGRPVVYWISDRELETNITTLCQSDPDAKAEFWARLFLKTVDCDPLALRHMSAYLERLGYEAANSIHRQWSNRQQYTQVYDQQGVWQIAWSFSSKPGEFFRTFEPRYPLENYARKTIEGKIKDEIVRSLGMRRKRSDWGLMRYSTRVYLRKALQNQGYRQPQLDCYLLVWDSFKEIYAPQKATNNRSLPAPTDEQLQQICHLYNQLLQLSQVAALSTATPATIEARLRECIQALRTYETILFVPIDAPVGGKDSLPLDETIPDPGSEYEWEQIEIQEPVEQLIAVLPTFLARLDSNTDNCLLLKHGFDLDYRSIAPFVGVYYTTVLNRDNRATQQLLTQVARWAQEKLNVTPDSESLERMQVPLKEYLNKYYKGVIFQLVFQKAWQQLDRQRRNILYLRYFRQMDELAISRQLQLGELEVSNGLVTGSQELAAAIKDWIQHRLNILPDLLNPLTDKIAIFVQKLIANHPDPDFK